MTSSLRRFAAAPVLAAWDILLPVKQTWWALFGIPLLAVMHWGGGRPRRLPVPAALRPVGRGGHRQAAEGRAGDPAAARVPDPRQPARPPRRDRAPGAAGARDRRAAPPPPPAAGRVQAGAGGAAPGARRGTARRPGRGAARRTPHGRGAGAAADRLLLGDHDVRPLRARAALPLAGQPGGAGPAPAPRAGRAEPPARVPAGPDPPRA